jgi:hypothetical protein
LITRRLHSLLGNIFISSKGHAQHPLAPHREGSTPTDLFPDLHKTFLDKEHRRVASFIESSVGCIDFRSITSVSLSSDDKEAAERHRQKKIDRCFDVFTAYGESFLLEAHSRDDAKEWVDYLKRLVAYWKRRCCLA